MSAIDELKRLKEIQDEAKKTIDIYLKHKVAKKPHILLAGKRLRNWRQLRAEKKAAKIAKSASRKAGREGVLYFKVVREEMKTLYFATLSKIREAIQAMREARLKNLGKIFNFQKPKKLPNSEFALMKSNKQGIKSKVIGLRDYKKKPTGAVDMVDVIKDLNAKTIALAEDVKLRA